jgi:thioredoxin reductase (NADPH)
MGPVLMEDMKQQAANFGTRIISDEVKTCDFSQKPFLITTSDTEFSAETVIIATGASARWLNIPGEQEYMGRGVSGCATCDGFFFRNKIVTVVGGGDTALEEANFLTKFAEKVYLIHRRDALRGSQVMQKRALDNPKIEIVWNSVVKEACGDNSKLTHLKIENLKTGTIIDHATNGFFVAIGHTPNTSLFKGKLEMEENGYIKIHNFVETSVPGVFAAGDVHDKEFRQAIVAAGAGCQAALRASKWLEDQE